MRITLKCGTQAHAHWFKMDETKLILTTDVILWHFQWYFFYFMKNNWLWPSNLTSPSTNGWQPTFEKPWLKKWIKAEKKRGLRIESWCPVKCLVFRKWGGANTSAWEGVVSGEPVLLDATWSVSLLPNPLVLALSHVPSPDHSPLYYFIPWMGIVFLIILFMMPVVLLYFTVCTVHWAWGRHCMS